MLTGRAGPDSAPEALFLPAVGQAGTLAAPDPLTFAELDAVKRATLFG